MLSFTRKADYAMVALVYLAHRRHNCPGPVSARLVAETLGLPMPVLMNTLKALARAELIESQRGVSGGYELAREPADLSLLEIVRAVERNDRPPPQPFAQSDAGVAHDNLAEAGMERETWDLQRDHSHLPSGVRAARRLQHKLYSFLESLTLADLLEHSQTPSASGMADAWRPGPA